MSLKHVQQGLIAKLLSEFSQWETDNRIAWENVAFSAPEGTSFMSVNFMPTGEDIATLGTGGLDESDGLFQVTISIPSGAGELDSRDIIDTLRDLFKPQTFGYEGQDIRILSRARSNGIEQNSFFNIPFTVTWQAYLIR